MKLQELKRDNSLSEKLYQRIYRQIVSGRLKAGQKLTESGMSESMGISRAPVREALKRLAEDRLVKLVPRSGCFVSKLDADQIEEIYEIRKRLECMALEYAFEKLNVDQIRDIRKQFAQCRKMSAADFVKKEIKLDAQLHNLISQSSGCPNLQELLSKLHARIQIVRIRQADYIDRAKDALSEHIKLLNAIISRNKKLAVKQLATHIDHTRKNMIRNIKNST